MKTAQHWRAFEKVLVIPVCPTMLKMRDHNVLQESATIKQAFQYTRGVLLLLFY